MYIYCSRRTSGQNDLTLKLTVFLKNSIKNNSIEYFILQLCRHPKTSERPTFATLVFKLSQPDCKVLYFLASDEGIHRQASVLGAPLEAGQNLYLDLQNMYDSCPINLNL